MVRNSLTQRFFLFKKLFPLIAEHRTLYFALAGLKLWFLALSLTSPLFYLILINKVMLGKNLSLLLPVILGYLGVYVLQTLGVVLEKRFYNRLYLNFRLKTQLKMLRTLVHMDINKYSAYHAGDLKIRIENDTSVLEKFFNTHILDFLYAVLGTIALAIILTFMSPLLALTGFVMIPVSFWFTKVMSKKVSKLNEERRECYGKYETFLHNSFQHWKEIKANNLESSQSEVLQRFRSKLSKLFVRNQIYWYINRAFIAFKDFYITRMNLYFIGGLLIINGRMDVGVLLVFMDYYSKLFQNITQLTDSLLGLAGDNPSIDRALEVLSISEGKKPTIRLTESNLAVKNLSFSYSKSQQKVLCDVQLDVQAHEHVAIVGRSGSGKSTLVKLIMGLYRPISGIITVGGIDINNISSESLGSKIGIVSQDPALFNLTIRENLLLAKKRATEVDISEACRKANILDFIDSLPDKFDTLIGERGIKLSGGQKQRLAIARIMLKDPDIVIFDEATSSLDSENEKAIVSAIHSLSQGKTLITISHRLSTVLSCDRVIVMDQGEIVACGRHQDLRGTNQIYDLLFAKQYNLEGTA